MKKLPYSSVLIALGIVFLEIATPAFCASNTWDGDGDGKWTNAVNWVGDVNIPGTPGGLPGDTATFNNAVNTTVSLDGVGRGLASLTFTSASVGAFSFNATGTERFTLASGGSISLSLGAAAVQTFNAPISLAGNYSLMNGGAAGAALIFNGNITNTNTSLLTLQGGVAAVNQINGIISDGGGVQSVAVSATGGTWELAGANTFTGALTKSGSSTLILSGTNNSAGTTILTGSGSVLALNSSSNGGLATGLFTLGGNSTLRSTGAAIQTISNQFGFSGSVLTTGDSANSGNLVFTGNGTQNATQSLFTANAALALEGNLSGGNTADLNKTGGYLFLMGANTYAGKTVFSGSNGQSTIVFNTIRNVGGGASSLGLVTSPNGTIGVTATSNNSAAVLRYIGGTGATDRAIDYGNGAAAGTLTAFALDASGSGALAWNGNISMTGTDVNARQVVLTGTNSDANTFSGALPNYGSVATGLAKTGTGSWTVTGATTFTGGVAVAGGRLVLDYSNGLTIDGSNALNFRSSINNTFGTSGGTLELIAKSSGSTSQSFGNLNLQAAVAAGASKIVLNPNGGAGLALTLGNTWTRDPATTLFIDLPSGTTLTSSPGLANGILQYAVVRDAAGIGFATTQAGNVIRNTVTTPLTSTSSSNTTNFSLFGNLTMAAGAKDFNSISIDGAGTLDLNGIVLGNSSFTKAILATGSGDYSITNGTVAGKEIIVHQYSSGVLAIPAISTATNDNFTKSGPGTLSLASKTGLGSLNILEGTLRAEGANVLTSGRILVGTGGVLELTANSGDFTGSLGTAAAGNIKLTGDGGFSASGVDRAVRLNGGTGVINWGSDVNFVPTNNALVLSGKNANKTIDFQNSLNLGNQQRVIQVNNGAARVDGRLSGTLSGGYGGGLIKNGTGALEVTATNTYAGDTWVNAGTLLVNNTTGSGTGLGKIIVNSGATLGGSGVVGGPAKILGGTLAPGNSPGLLSFQADLTLSGTATTSTFEILGLTRGSLYDAVNLAGGSHLAYDGLLSLVVTGSMADGTYDLFSFTSGNQTGDFDSIVFSGSYTGSMIDSSGLWTGTFGGSNFTFDIATGDLTVAAVPEPSTCAMLVTAGVAAAFAIRRRRTTV